MLEHLDQNSHALWTHLEKRLRSLWEAQVLESLVLSLNILAHALEFLSKHVLHAWVIKEQLSILFQI